MSEFKSDDELIQREHDRLDAQIKYGRQVCRELQELGLSESQILNLTQKHKREIDEACHAGSRAASLAELLHEYAESDDLSERVRQYIIAQNAENKRLREEASPYKVMHGYDSQESAYIVEDYPWGYHVRCRQRHWIEQAVKGTHKLKYRHCIQTSEKEWSKKYTELLVEAGIIGKGERMPCGMQEKDFPQHIQDFCKTATWCNPKKSNYYYFMFLYTDERGHVNSGAIEPFDAANKWVAFRNMWQINEKLVGNGVCQFDSEQLKMLAMMEDASRKYNTSSWAEWQEEHGVVKPIGELITVKGVT